MQFERIAVISDDDAWSSDYGKGVADSVEKGGGVVLYHGIFPQLKGSLGTSEIVDKQGQLHLEGVKNITAHLHHAREAKARIVFVMAKSDVSKVAMYSALEKTGFLGEGFAVVDGQILSVTNDLVASGTLRMNGVLHLTVEEAYACRAVRGCQKGDVPPGILVRVNQAHDAVYTLAAAIGPMFQDGGHSYLQGTPESRLAAMAAIRSTSLSPDIAMSGLLQFPDPAVNNRDVWNFGYTMWNVVGTPGSQPKNVAVGRVFRDEFKLNNKDVAVIWPGGTTKVPQDTLRSDPKNLSIGWVVESAWGTVATRQESRMYAQQAIDEINDNAYILPNTHLTLEVDESVQGNDKTVEAANAIEARAKAAGRPVAAMLGSSSSHMASLYNPQANANGDATEHRGTDRGFSTQAPGCLATPRDFPILFDCTCTMMRDWGEEGTACVCVCVCCVCVCACVCVRARARAVVAVQWGGRENPYLYLTHTPSPRASSAPPRRYPPVSEMQHIFRKVALQFGWNRVGLIGDKKRRL